MKLGDRVRYSPSAVTSLRDYWQCQGRQPQKNRAEDAYRAKLAERGTVVELLDNGLSVEWDCGSVSNCLSYVVCDEASLLFAYLPLGLDPLLPSHFKGGNR